MICLEIPYERLPFQKYHKTQFTVLQTDLRCEDLQSYVIENTIPLNIVEVWKI